MKRFYFLIAFLVIVAGGIGYAAGRNWDKGNGWHDRNDNQVEVVQANGQETIVVHDRDRGFFPFGILFIPLFFFLIFGLGRAFFWRGRGGGPWNGGPDRFEEWHRRAHANEGQSPTQSDGPPAAS